jgi:hypothetical protein
MTRATRRRTRASVTPSERRAAVEERRVRALEEALDVRLRSEDVYPILEVRNPLHGTAYRVLLPEFPSAESAFCTCTDFARRGLGTCKHLEAGFRWLSEHPETPPLLPREKVATRVTGVWKEIDQRVAALARDTARESLRYRRPGDVLFEGAKGR